MVGMAVEKAIRVNRQVMREVMDVYILAMVGVGPRD